MTSLRTIWGSPASAPKCGCAQHGVYFLLSLVSEAIQDSSLTCEEPQWGRPGFAPPSSYSRVKPRQIPRDGTLGALQRTDGNWYCHSGGAVAPRRNCTEISRAYSRSLLGSPVFTRDVGMCASHSRTGSRARKRWLAFSFLCLITAGFRALPFGRCNMKDHDAQIPFAGVGHWHDGGLQRPNQLRCTVPDRSQCRSSLGQPH